jgi:hypothetical protein
MRSERRHRAHPSNPTVDFAGNCSGGGWGAEGDLRVLIWEAEALTSVVKAVVQGVQNRKIANENSVIPAPSRISCWHTALP